MQFLLRSLLFLALCVPALGAEVLPTAGKSVGIVRDDTPGSWAVVSSTFEAVDVHEIEGTAAEGFKGCYWEAPAGKYLVIKSGGGKLKTFAVTLGGVAPSPVPVPPGPGPEPPPNPPVPPVPTPAGPRTVLVLRESADDTPALARLYTSLQAGQAHQYLKSKGHSCFVLDDDARDASGQPIPLVEKWKAAINLPVPCLAILDDKANILIKATLGPDATDAYVLDILKAKEAK